MQNSQLPLQLAEVHTGNSQMRILYVAMKYDYGKPEQGYSFEHCNFYESLRHTGHDILYFDFVSLMQKYGQREMNQRLIEVVKVEKPDLMFTFLFEDELEQKTLMDISETTGTITLNWFADDHWRFDNYSCNWATCFNWAVTTAQSALPKYANLGYRNVIKSQWGCNHFIYKKLDLPFEYDVTFIGQPHGDRRQLIEQLQNTGLKVQTWGNGWSSGRISQEEMIRVFNTSRINLNLTNSIALNGGDMQASKNLHTRILSRLKRSIPFSASKKLQQPTQLFVPQIKGRNFEIPGCGGFLLTGKADNLEDYYLPNQDIVCFESIEDLIGKIYYYLEHEDERKDIALSGYERTLKEHTYAQRFDSIFKQIGLPSSFIDKDSIGLSQTIEVT